MLKKAKEDLSLLMRSGKPVILAVNKRKAHICF